MRLFGLIVALVSFGAGLISAYYWFIAGRIGISPAWNLDIPGETEKNIMGWVTGNMIAFTKSGQLNKRAACWTAVAVALGAISNFIAALGR